MKTAITKTILAVCIVFLSVTAFGQEVREAYQQAMDKIFSGIPAEKVTTGILIERAPSFVNMFLYEGAHTEITDTCNASKWKQMYLQLNMAHLNSRKFNYESSIVETDYGNKTATGNIPIGIIFYDYNRMDPQALQKGLLSIDTVRGVIRDISGRNEATLKEVTCFAASPMVEVLQSGTYSFYLEPSLFISNKTHVLDEVSIDFGDGKGFVTLPAGGKVSAHFDKPGFHTLTLKATQKDMIHISHSAFYVQEAKMSLRAGTLGTDPERTPDIYFSNFTTGVGANEIRAHYGIWYRCNHDNTVRKPFIIVSGYDASDENRIWEDPYDGNDVNEKRYLYHVSNKNGFLDRLRENGYDIIVYRSTNSTKSIISNAMNLVALIQQINNTKTSSNELVIMGASMGGLIVRYALTYMEYQNINHKTRLFVSLDSPQNGANIPLGLQHMIASLYDDFNGIITVVEKLKDAKNVMLGCDAAKEMLLYHHTATNINGYTAHCSPNRTTYLNSLASIGNFPQKCQSIAISMGSGTATSQGFSAGQTLLKKNESAVSDVFFLSTAFAILLAEGITAGIIPPGTNGLIAALTQLRWEFEVKAVPDHSSSTIFHEYIKLGPCFHVPILIPLPPFYKDETFCLPVAKLKERTVTVNNTAPLDNAPGSTIGLHNLTEIVKNDALPNLLSFLNLVIKENNRDGFIPAYSALGLSVAPHTHLKNYLNANMVKINNNDRYYRNYNKTVSPFDYVYIEETNSYHISDPNKNSALSPSMVAIMNDFLIPSQLVLDNITIASGQSVAYEMPGVVTLNSVIVEPGGQLDIKAADIILGTGFEAKYGSLVNLSVGTPWICPNGSIP